MYIKLTKVHFDSLDLTEEKLYKVKDKRESLADCGTKIITIDIEDDSGDIETLVNFDEADYEYVIQ